MYKPNLIKICRLIWQVWCSEEQRPLETLQEIEPYLSFMMSNAFSIFPHLKYLPNKAHEQKMLYADLSPGSVKHTLPFQMLL